LILYSCLLCYSRLAGIMHNGLGEPSVAGLNLLILLKALILVISSKFLRIPFRSNYGYILLYVNFYVGFSLFQGGLNKVFR